MLISSDFSGKKNKSWPPKGHAVRMAAALATLVRLQRSDAAHQVFDLKGGGLQTV
jgi:hypothetical protein